jgi:hypothetical protein
MTQKRYRLKFNFWLDVTKAEEFDLAEKIETLKVERSFASTVRDGIRLIWDLRQGRTAVLLELFPFVREALAGNRAGGDDGKVEQVQRQIAELERLLLAQDGGQVMAPVATQGGPKPLSIPRPAAAPPPAADDLPALVVTKSKAPAGNSAAAFLDSAFAIAGMQ